MLWLMPLLPHKSKLYKDKPYVPKLKRATHYIQILLFSSASYWQSNHNVMPMMRDETVFRVILFICFMSRRWNVYCTSKCSRFHFLKFTCLYEPPVLMSKLYFTFYFYTRLSFYTRVYSTLRCILQQLLLKVSAFPTHCIFVLKIVSD